MITAEMINWTGKVVVAPRTRLADLLARNEAGRTGIYFLSGPDADRPGSSRVYLGEGDNVGRRVAQHDSDEDKDFFNKCCIIVSKDENFTKAHARYLEARLLQIARGADRARLANTQVPDFAAMPLPESDRADMEFVVEQLRVILPVLGFDFLEPAIAIVAVAPIGSAAISEVAFEFAGGGTKAVMREHGDEFVVLAGSTVRKRSTDTCPEGYRLRREQLLQDGVLIDESDGYWRLVRDVAFTSPSTAGGVIYGGSVAGPIQWKVKGTGQTYKDWRAARLAEAAPEKSED